MIVIVADSRSFSQTHDASNESEVQSSLSKRELLLLANSRSFSQIHDHSRWFTMRIVNSIHRLQRQNFNLTIFFWLAYFYERFDDFILSIRVFRRAICFDRKFDRMSISLANSVREICCVRDNESSSLRIEKNFVLKMYNRHELNCVEDEIVTNWQRSCFFLFVDRLIASVKFTSLVTIKIKYYVKNRVWINRFPSHSISEI